MLNFSAISLANNHFEDKNAHRNNAKQVIVIAASHYEYGINYNHSLLFLSLSLSHSLSLSLPLSPPLFSLSPSPPSLTLSPPLSLFLSKNPQNLEFRKDQFKDPTEIAEQFKGDGGVIITLGKIFFIY